METSCKNLIQENQDVVRDLFIDNEGEVVMSPTSSTLHILELPDSIVLHIFSFLPFSSIGAAAQVCSQWYHISYDELLWRHVFLLHFQLPSKTTMPPKANSWRLEFKRLYYHTPAVLSEERKEHKDEVLHVSFSHDGTMFATCSKDGFFKVWECTHPVRLLFKMDMKNSFSWKFTQFSQFNETDTCLLVSGVYFGRLSTSGEIAVFNLQDDFRMQCRVTNKPYDVFGAWYDNDHLLSGTLYWTGDFNSVSAVWLSKASQEVDSEVESVSMVLYRFENVNSSSIRLLHVAEVDRDSASSIQDKEETGYSGSGLTSPRSCSLGPEDDGKSSVSSEMIQNKLEAGDKGPSQAGGEEKEEPCILDQLLRKYIAEDEFDMENEDKTDEDESKEDIQADVVIDGGEFAQPHSDVGVDPSFADDGIQNQRCEADIEVDENVQVVEEIDCTIEREHGGKAIGSQTHDVCRQDLPELQQMQEEMCNADVGATVSEKVGDNGDCGNSRMETYASSSMEKQNVSENLESDMDGSHSYGSSSTTLGVGRTFEEMSKSSMSLQKSPAQHFRTFLDVDKVEENVSESLRTNMPVMGSMEEGEGSIAGLSGSHSGDVNTECSIDFSDRSSVEVAQNQPETCHDSSTKCSHAEHHVQSSEQAAAFKVPPPASRPSNLCLRNSHSKAKYQKENKCMVQDVQMKIQEQASKSSQATGVVGSLKDSERTDTPEIGSAVGKFQDSEDNEISDATYYSAQDLSSVSNFECDLDDCESGAVHINEPSKANEMSGEGSSVQRSTESDRTSEHLGAQGMDGSRRHVYSIDSLNAISDKMPFFSDENLLMLVPGASNILSRHHRLPHTTNTHSSMGGSSSSNNHNSAGASFSSIMNDHDDTSNNNNTDNTSSSCPEGDVASLDLLAQELSSTHSQKSSIATQTEVAPSRASSFQSLTHLSHSSSMSRDLHASPPREKLLIYTWGSETYIPHKIGIKRMRWTDFTKGEVRARRSSMLLPDVMENLHNMAGNRRDKPDVTIEMHGHIVGLSLSPDHRYLYVNCRPWPQNYIISDPQESPPLAQEVEISTIDLTTFKFVGPVLRSHKAYTHSDECFFLNLDVAEDYVASGAEDRQGYLWDRHYGIPLYRFPHRSVVNCVAVNPQDPEVLVTVSDDYTFKVWMSRSRANELAASRSEVKNSDV